MEGWPTTAVCSWPRTGGRIATVQCVQERLKRPAISVVVPTYNRAHALQRMLRPLLRDPAAMEVIVVVDGSRDSSVEVISRLATEEARLRCILIGNSGEMAAREAGARAARGEIILFIDDDVLVGPGLVAGHALRHTERKGRVVVGYIPVRISAVRASDEFASRIYAREYEDRCAIYERDVETVLRELWAGNFSMPRADCLAIGMANPNYTERYHPDRDFGIRCLAAGLSGVFDRSLRATHLHERSLEGFARDARSQGAARVLTHRLHPGIAPPLTADEFERGLPSAMRALVRVCRRPRIHVAVVSALMGLVRGAGAARAWGVQDASARTLRRLEQHRGAIDESHGRRR